MGMYGDALNKLDDSLYVKIEPGKPVTLRLLDHPWISQKQFVDQATGESRIVTQFHWPVWDYAQNRVRVLTQGKSVFKEVANACDTWPAGETMPSPFDIIIKRTGTGRYDTEYSVTAVPYSGTMPRVAVADLPNMQEKSGGIPLKQVLEGKAAPVIAFKPKDGQALPEPKRPTHDDAAALDAPPIDSREPEPEGTDTVITDLDAETEIDFASIPDSDDDDGTTPALERPEFLQ